MTTKIKPGKIASVVGSIVVLASGIAIWYPILKAQGVPVWGDWHDLKENSEHLMLLLVSALAIATIPERLASENRKMRFFWGLALIVTILIAIIALAKIGQSEPSDYPRLSVSSD